MEKVQVFECGPYKKHDCTIRRKYSENREPVVLPEEFTVLIVPSGMTDGLLKSLAIAHGQDAVQDNR